MRPARPTLRLGSLCFALTFTLLIAGCGDDDKGGPIGVVSETWAQYCVATFEADYPVVDPWDDPMFTIRAGQQYLLSRYNMGFFDEDRAELLYLTPAGPIDFEITVPAGEPFPFTSNCASDAMASRIGVFANTSIYAEVGFTTKVCELPEGTVSNGGTLNYSFAGDNLLDSRAPYQVSFGDAFDAQCPGVTEGFVRSGRHAMGGTQYSVIPLATLAGPN